MVASGESGFQFLAPALHNKLIDKQQDKAYIVQPNE